jgi:hypothetical protein
MMTLGFGDIAPFKCGRGVASTMAGVSPAVGAARLSVAAERERRAGVDAGGRFLALPAADGVGAAVPATKWAKRTRVSSSTTAHS